MTIFSTKNQPLGYYVYAYIRNKDSDIAKAGTPYYIGKGKGKRAWVNHGYTVTPKDLRFIVILESNLNEIGALALERRYIEWWGRRSITYTDRPPGILVNKSEGGQYVPSTIGRIGRRSKNKNPHPSKGKTFDEINGVEDSNKIKQKIKDSNNTPIRRKQLQDAGRKGANHIRGKTWSEEIIEKRIATRKNNNNFNVDMSACHTDEAIRKRTETRRKNGGYKKELPADWYSNEKIFQKQRTKLLNHINKIENHYNIRFSLHLFKLARKEKFTYIQDKTLFKYLTREELTNYEFVLP